MRIPITNTAHREPLPARRHGWLFLATDARGLLAETSGADTVHPPSGLKATFGLRPSDLHSRLSTTLSKLSGGDVRTAALNVVWRSAGVVYFGQAGRRVDVSYVPLDATSVRDA